MSFELRREQARAMIRRIMNDDGYMVSGEANLLVRIIDEADLEQREHHDMMHGMHQREAKLRAACEEALKLLDDDLVAEAEVYLRDALGISGKEGGA